MKSILLQFSLIIMLASCAKNESETNSLNNANEVISKKGFENHLISKEDAQKMMSSFDNYIGASLSDKYKLINSSYEPIRMATYDVDVLIDYLNYIKHNGSSRVHIRYAANINSDERLSKKFIPYQTLVFFGNKPNQLLDSADNTLYLDKGELCPQICN